MLDMRIHRQESQKMLLNKQNHGKQKAKQREHSRNKGGNHGFGTDPEEKQKNVY